MNNFSIYSKYIELTESTEVSTIFEKSNNYGELFDRDKSHKPQHKSGVVSIQTFIEIFSCTIPSSVSWTFFVFKSFYYQIFTELNFIAYEERYTLKRTR